MYKIFLIFIALFVTTSCNKTIKEKIGIVTTGPNEYKVQRGKSLEVPPHYDLPSPYQTHNSQSEVREIPANLNEGERELIKEIESK